METNKSLAAKLLEGFDEDCVAEGNIGNPGLTAIKIVGNKRLGGPSSGGSYYKEYKTNHVKVRFSDHLPNYRDIKKSDSGINTLVLVFTRKFSDVDITDRIDDILDETSREKRRDLPKTYLYDFANENSDDVEILRVKRKIGGCLGVSSSASIKELNKKLYEAVLKWDKLKQFSGQSQIPKIGFIRPDGAFIDITKHGADHIEFAKKVMESINESEYKNMLEFTEMGYIRFKIDMGEAIVQTSTYPTRQQFVTVRDCFDQIGKGVFEIYKDKRPNGYIEMTRDTLDADMRKLEALLNKVKPPQPKTS